MALQQLRDLMAFTSHPNIQADFSRRNTDSLRRRRPLWKTATIPNHHPRHPETRENAPTIFSADKGMGEGGLPPSPYAAEDAPDDYLLKNSPPAAPSSPSRAGRASSTDRPGGDEDDMSVAELQASVRELLRTQGLGSGSWKKSGVPAAVEREQRTLAREVKAMGRKRRWRDVLDVVGRARYQGTELNSIIYGCAISAVGRCGRWKEALALLEQMREDGIEPEEDAYNSAIAACTGANEWQRALVLFRRMQELCDCSGDGIGGNAEESNCRGDGGNNAYFPEGRAKPGTATYNAAIAACARGLQTEEVLSLLMEMSARGVPRDEMSFNAAIDACGRGGSWQKALELLYEMRNAGLRPSLVSYNAALDACARESRWEEAADLMDTMRGGVVEETGESASVEGLTTQQTVAPVLKEMGLPATLGEGGQDKFSSALKACVRSSRAPWRPPIPDTYSYNCCIAACRKGGESGLARLFFAEMMSAGLRPNAATFLLMLLDPRDKPAGLRARLSPQDRAGDASRRSGERLGRPGLGGTARVPPQRWRQALSMLDEVDGEGLGLDPPCLNLVLTLCAKAGRWEESRRLLKDLREVTRPGDPMFPGVSRYNSVLNMLRNAPFPPRQSPAEAIALTSRDAKSRPEISAATGLEVRHGSMEATGRGQAFLDAGGKFGGAEGWSRGHVAAFLSDMRTVGLKPDNETYRCAVRCATDAAMFDEARAMSQAAVTEGVDEMLEVKAAASEDIEVASAGAPVATEAEGKSGEVFR